MVFWSYVLIEIPLGANDEGRPKSVLMRWRP
jgi:hypothetical protein